MEERPLRFLEAALDAAEEKLIELVRANRLTPDAEGESRVERIVSELRWVHKAIREAEGQRDRTYRATQQLRELRSRCLWLYRRLVQEWSFVRKYDLENRLRQMISPAAFDLYLALEALDLEDDPRALSDEEVTRRLEN
ncbi:MAG: hypothetical protein QN163_06490 [Armatimonadota bacterium]|nr:hypothetical protein [Armatimonadota bacterium]MDR5697427.1 hypothetical protein [Armatimonadota bacterium]